VHPLRLQYVEFFSKFYEDGGEPFEPLALKTSKIVIDEE
jgi:V/A-type H+-transporting ATPase subunit I